MRIDQHVAGLLVGVASAVGTEVLVRRHAPRRRLALLGAGLPVAAAIYPAARSGDRHGHHARREVAALAAYSAWVLASSRADRDRAARLLAAGWASHAAFDALHDGGGHSLIPAWYPALCAGYDVVIAAGLLQRRA